MSRLSTLYTSGEKLTTVRNERGAPSLPARREGAPQTQPRACIPCATPLHNTSRRTSSKAFSMLGRSLQLLVTLDGAARPNSSMFALCPLRNIHNSAHSGYAVTKSANLHGGNKGNCNFFLKSRSTFIYVRMRIRHSHNPSIHVHQYPSEISIQVSAVAAYAFALPDLHNDYRTLLSNKILRTC